MNKRVICILGAVTISALILVSAYSQDDMVVVDNSVFSKPARTPAVFVHDEHNETAGIEACNECHHVYEDGVKLEDESSEDQMCSDCHGLAAEGRMPGLMRAFHINCKGCHMAMKKGPVTCGECHRKP